MPGQAPAQPTEATELKHGMIRMSATGDAGVQQASTRPKGPGAVQAALSMGFLPPHLSQQKAAPGVVSPRGPASPVGQPRQQGVGARGQQQGPPGPQHGAPMQQAPAGPHAPNAAHPLASAPTYPLHTTAAHATHTGPIVMPTGQPASAGQGLPAYVAGVPMTIGTTSSVPMASSAPMVPMTALPPGSAMPGAMHQLQGMIAAGALPHGQVQQVFYQVVPQHDGTVAWVPVVMFPQLPGQGASPMMQVNGAQGAQQVQVQEVSFGDAVHDLAHL